MLEGRFAISSFRNFVVSQFRRLAFGRAQMWMSVSTDGRGNRPNSRLREKAESICENFNHRVPRMVVRLSMIDG
jgi:hypothetical protein